MVKLQIDNLLLLLFVIAAISLLIGLLAGLQTQPAVLGFAVEQTGNNPPNRGYANMFALAVIVKIIVAQLPVALLR